MRNTSIDTFKLPVMLTALRLPGFQKHWQNIAEQADKEAWPAARFLAVLAEYEIAERETRRIQRHFNEAKLLAGKTLATYQFEAMPSLPKAHIEALAGGTGLSVAAISLQSEIPAQGKPISCVQLDTP